MNVVPRFDIPYERKGILTPGLPILPNGTERYLVQGGGSCVVPIRSGDEIATVNLEGLQSIEMVFFASNGHSDAGMLGAIGSGIPNDTIKILSSDSKSAAIIRQRLINSNIDLAQGDAIRDHCTGSIAGTMRTYFSTEDGVLIVSAPGGPMSPENQNSPTDIALYIIHTDPSAVADFLSPPEPLANPLQDINIQPGEARVYEVKKGEFIQILDVQGRECSDFQAFSLRDLDRYIEREIDPTATRSLTGTIYPTPGLYSKFFNVDFKPLVQIVQDTCGRHDAFGLACTAKYYEDMGYPGHLNCSDNISKGLGKYDVKPRAGWPAINFFFNTMIDGTNSMALDDPWSRPGDYVLLRALTDLVCVSTGCPCDVDAANGWYPTDIQVRTYNDDEDFRPSYGYRKSVEGKLEMTKQTGFHDCFSKFTRDFVEYSGYWLPNTMTNFQSSDEYWGCRLNVAVMDLSPLRKYEVTGPDAEDLLQLCVTRNIRKLSDRQVVYTAMCYEHGGMIDDGTVYRLGPLNFRWVGGSDDSGLWLQKQSKEMGMNAWIRNSTDQLHNISVQGRYARDVLEKIFWTAPKEASIAELEWFRFSVARIGDEFGTACIVSRTGYTGELGFEIFCHPSDAKSVFDSVWEAGQQYSIVPLGLEALNMLRIEAGLVFAGYEFCDQTDPFEAGIGFTVPLATHNDDFIGRQALEERKAHPVRKLVGLEIKSGLVPSTGDSLRVGKAKVGEITSAVRSPYLGCTIALARVDVRHSAIGTKLKIGLLDGYQKSLKAKIVSFPHFDPKKRRVRGEYITV